MGNHKKRKYISFVFSLLFVLAGSFPMMGQAQDRKSYEIKQHAINHNFDRSRNGLYDAAIRDDMRMRDENCGNNQEFYKGECVTQGTEECEDSCDKETYVCVDIGIKVVCSELQEFIPECETDDECSSGLQCHPKFLSCVQFCTETSECEDGAMCHDEGFCVAVPDIDVPDLVRWVK